ncbi:hypothetical protein [Acidocella sp.]|uniref:hypothetical protein n=1 Tax=Acidocella sp. TaxID=50710 RepID=UPI00260DA315|nr:hypothetical protein [Acidocella sp.]
MYQVNGLYTITVNGVQQFQSANPGAGIANGTQVTTAWLNDVQGELLNFLSAAQIVGQPNTPNQVKASTDFLYGFKFGILSANKAVTSADRGTVFICNAGCSTVTVPVASGFDAGFFFGLQGGAGAPTTVNVLDQINDGDVLAGDTSFTLNNTSFVLLQAQGTNWGVLSCSPDLAGEQALITLTPAASDTVTPTALLTLVSPNFTANGVVTIAPAAGGDRVRVNSQVGFTVTVELSSGTMTLPDGSAPASVLLPASAGCGIDLISNGAGYFATTFGQTVVAPAVAANQAVQLGQADGRYAALAGSAAQVFSAAPATVATEAATLGQSVGSALQVWRNVTSSRVSGTVYTNSGAAPLMVAVNTPMGGNTGLTLYVKSVLVAQCDNNTSQTGNYIGMQLTAIVPPGSTYYCTASPGSIFNWAELS